MYQKAWQEKAAKGVENERERALGLSVRASPDCRSTKCVAAKVQTAAKYRL